MLTIDNRPLSEQSEMHLAEVQALRRRVKELERELAHKDIQIATFENEKRQQYETDHHDS